MKLGWKLLAAAGDCECSGDLRLRICHVAGITHGSPGILLERDIVYDAITALRVVPISAMGLAPVTWRTCFRKPMTQMYPEGQAQAAAALPWPAPVAALSRRAGEVHRLLAVCCGLPVRCHSGDRRREHAGAPCLSRRALCRGVRDQHDPLHLLRLLRRGLPDGRHCAQA